MAVTDSRLLRGTLTFGDADNAFAQQVTSFVCEQQDGESEDAVPVLSGEEVGGGTTAGPWHITGTAIQDFDNPAGLQRWSHQNRDTVQPFSFVPNDLGTAPEITGEVRVKFLGLGGEVKVRVTRDFDWSCVGEPDFAWPAVTP